MQALRNPLLVLLIALLFLGRAANGQTVTKIEYFFDTDPGHGKGSAIAVTPATDVTASFQLDINPLTNGFHNLYVRGYIPPYQVTENGQPVTKGGWSITHVRNFYKEKFQTSAGNFLSPIVAGEFFVDGDPGFGSGKPISISQGTDLSNVSFAFDVTSLAKGFHQLTVRFKDAAGTWSVPSTRSFYKESFSSTSPGTLANITQGEYFFDTDPGFGSGTAISLQPGTDLTLSFTTDVTTLAKGFHQLHVRFKDAAGAWAHTQIRTFYKDVYSSATTPLAKVQKLEYFIDTDPGFGNGTAVALTPAHDINNFEYMMDLSNVSIGNHKVYVRAQDEAGVWSLVSSGNFKIEPPTDLIITLGNINTINCAGSTVAIPFTVNAPFGTNNIFTAQLSDASGNFGNNPVSLGSVTGNGDSTIQATIPAGTNAGSNYRIRIVGSSPFDTSGKSGPINIKRVPEAYLTIAGNQAVCLGTATYSASPLDANATTYTWSLADGGTLDTVQGNSVHVNWTKAGNFTLKMTASNMCGNGVEKTHSVKVFPSVPSLVPIITASGKNLSVSNLPSSDSVNAYRWYKDGVLAPSLNNYSVTPTQDG
ncbi:MAG: PKD domain-containing protein, partial [Chitinophagaceae bacterium]